MQEQIALARVGPVVSAPARAERLAALAPADLAALGASYAAGLKALAPGHRRVTDKMPSNFRLIGLIRLILPQARIIHSVPRAT